MGYISFLHIKKKKRKIELMFPWNIKKINAHVNLQNLNHMNRKIRWLSYSEGEEKSITQTDLFISFGPQGFEGRVATDCCHRFTSAYTIFSQ